MINNKLKKCSNILVMNEKTNISAVDKNSISYSNKSHHFAQISFAVSYTRSFIRKGRIFSHARLIFYIYIYI